MQEANQMQDKVDMTVQKALNPMTYISTLQSLYYAQQSLAGIIAWFKGKKSEELCDKQPTKNDLPVKFTGQHTDIANITRYENNLMPVDELYSIDPKFKQNTLEEFDIALKNGYIEVVEQDAHKYFSLTDKGREHINSEAFLRQYEQHQLGNFLRSEPKMVVNFQGNEDDLNVFRYVDKIDISQESDKVKDYFVRCEKADFVKIDNGIVTPTKLTQKWLERTENNALKNGNIKLVTPDNIKSVVKTAKQPKAEVSTVTDNLKMVAQNNTQPQFKVTEATTDIVKETVKNSAKQGASTSIGVASGSVTAGVGTVITIRVEAAKLLVKGLAQQQSINNPQTRAIQ